MEFRKLSIDGAWEVTPKQLGDSRGMFMEAFKRGPFVDHIGHPLALAQINTSVSARGVLRGIHFADVPPGQAKFVSCQRGSALDVIVDIRVGSPTFGQWDSVLLNTVDRRAVYLSEGLGHAFLALEDDTTITYVCSEGYAPGREHGINPLDPEVGIEWPADVEFELSEKDSVAPTLEQALDSGLLPRLTDCNAYAAKLRGE